MTRPVVTILAAISAFATVACSEATEDTAALEVAVEETAQTTMQNEQATNAVFEVCDADGNRYPSEAKAEAAGLARAEYGATFCDYVE